ncbi:hypothetical protein [Flammeovirga kamogawensis]|uniref:YopX protein domain-containing protein n=1 Tax=Flammeovirga kamogawensis TaxID=373891 RepID=A0ABX8GUD4_9BACT|nr:hypothetical protein [Flammeovirga kamogawensis]MBB6459939.1 hypothetical protein [Flammeovirga kamogawensis]QWG07008.1 hypothetical protein KM029_17160 [Flammeovirga kamogawensis]TRX68829.1 hypothetical protein EO216_12145 [Flammeovirga kamogawensis]
MNLLKWFINFFTSTNNKNIDFWDGDTSIANIKARFILLQQGYLDMHATQHIKQDNDSIIVETVQGYYSFNGHNSWGTDSSYTGSLKIEHLIDNKYTCTWEMGIGNQTQKGNGFLFEDLLCINFTYKDLDNLFNGIVIYKFINQTEAKGFWIEEGIYEVGFEEISLKNKGFI